MDDSNHKITEKEIENSIRRGRLNFRFKTNWDFIPFTATILFIFFRFSFLFVKFFGVRSTGDIVFYLIGALVSLALIFYAKWSLKIRLKLWSIDHSISKMEIIQKLEAHDWHPFNVNKYYIQASGQNSIINYGYTLTIVEKDMKMLFNLHPNSNRPFATLKDLKEIKRITAFLNGC